MLGQAVLRRDPPADQAARVARAALRQHPSAEPASPDYSTPAGMRREDFRAMGTTISLLLPENQAELGLQIVRTLFTEWEQTLSRFLPDSELSQLNEHAGTATAVSDLLYSVLATALTAARATQGVYGPALLDQLVQVGYDRTFDDLQAVRAPGFDPIIPGEPGGRWRGIKVDPIRRRVTLPAGIKLDFGGIAKGMAVDAALEQLRLSGVSPALVNAGGDLAGLGLPPYINGTWEVPSRHTRRAISGRSPSWQTGVNRPRWRRKSPLFSVPGRELIFCAGTVSRACFYARMAHGKPWSRGRRILWRRNHDHLANGHLGRCTC